MDCLSPAPLPARSRMVVRCEEALAAGRGPEKGECGSPIPAWLRLWSAPRPR